MVKKKIGVLKRGAWAKEEDTLLRNCIQKFGEGKWNKIPSRAGLNRCRKSCRLRWLNYLRPNIKRGYFAEDEVDLIQRLHKLLGNRWSMIAGRLPGRTANDVKNYWNTHILKKSPSLDAENETKNNILFKPRPRTFTKSHLPMPSEKEENKTNETKDVEYNKTSSFSNVPFSLSGEEIDECIRCWLDEPTPVLFNDGADVVSPRQLNQKIAEFSSLVIDAHVWDFNNFD